MCVSGGGDTEVERRRGAPGGRGWRPACVHVAPSEVGAPGQAGHAARGGEREESLPGCAGLGPQTPGLPRKERGLRRLRNVLPAAPGLLPPVAASWCAPLGLLGTEPLPPPRLGRVHTPVSRLFGEPRTPKPPGILDPRVSWPQLPVGCSCWGCGPCVTQRFAAWCLLLLDPGLPCWLQQSGAVGGHELDTQPEPPESLAASRVGRSAGAGCLVQGRAPHARVWLSSHVVCQTHLPGREGGSVLAKGARILQGKPSWSPPDQEAPGRGGRGRQCGRDGQLPLGGPCPPVPAPTMGRSSEVLSLLQGTRALRARIPAEY